MAKTVWMGIQSFEKIRERKCFYVDKTGFIKEWWENQDDVTLIARPRRFGKTLNLKITFSETRKKICYTIEKVYNRHQYLLEGNLLNQKEKDFFCKVSAGMEGYMATSSLGTLSEYLYRYYGRKVIILLDEHDTPMQEAYVHGYWEELVEFTRSLFNCTFKTNPYLDRAVMTGITRNSKESIFSDLNNLEVVTTTSEKYETSFGFTQQEVWDALDKCGLSEKRRSQGVV